MITFIDEAGRFTRDDKVSLVGALSLPSREAGPVRRELGRLSSAWPKHRDELKGGALPIAHLADLVDLLFRHDALLYVTAINVAGHDVADLERHKRGQSEGITKFLTADHHPDIVEKAWELRRTLEAMPLQLYVQCVLMLEMVYKFPFLIAAYFAQRRPRELAQFDWIIDAKDPLRVTTQEAWWRDVIGPSVERKAMREPSFMVDGDGFNYRFMRRSFEIAIDAPDPAEAPEMGFDIRKLIIEKVQFVNSRMDILLQAVDILANFSRRALLGTLSDEIALAALGRLQLHQKVQSVQLVKLGKCEWPYTGLAARLKVMKRANRSMFKPEGEHRRNRAPSKR